MRAALLALLCAGCGSLLGIDDVSLGKDAAVVDAPGVDRPPDAAGPMPDATTDGAGCMQSGGPCQPMNPCHVGRLECVSGQAVCMDTGTAVTDGTSCNDRDACTQTDSCQSGVCVGANPVVCQALDQCHVAGTCDPATGICSNPNQQNGTACDDGNACTAGETCQNGGCGSPATTVTCMPADQCHDAGSCNPATGTCSNPNKQDGTACNDGSACTSGETCQNGSCSSPTSTVTCMALDQCHVAGTCNPTTGVCQNPLASNGTPCDDGRACTTGDSCQAGMCVPAVNACGCTTDADCPALDQCHLAGTCNVSTGVCSNPPRPNGTSCNDGSACTSGETCQSGSCGSPTSTVTCSALDQCHLAGTCDPANGSCSNPNKTNGTACDDGSACTSGESCQNGACGSPTSVTTCSAIDQCHLAGSCDPASGICSNPNQTNGTVCDDGSACTSGETCQNGACGSPTSTVTCMALDSCHDAGTCSPATGMCSNPPKPDGTSCGTGVSCMGGQCLCTQQSCSSGCCQNNTCQPGNQVGACGSGGASCTTCMPPANASATCDGTNCGFTCNSGFHNCSGACVNNNSIANCGSSCTACVPPANASATCDGTNCGFTCNSGFHLCNGACVNNNSTDNCGTTSCVPCPTDPNGSATCNGTSCGISCNSSYNLCAGNVCRHCCTAADCPSDPNSSGATCNGSGNCVYSCFSCYHQCGNACVSNTSTTSCGPSSCTPCSAPPNATPTCTGGSCNTAACTFICNAGFTADGAGGCTPAPPRPVAPISVSYTTSRRPTFRWVLNVGTDGAHIDICPTRACSSFDRTADLTGGATTYTPPVDLAPGVHFWRLYGRVGSTTGTVASPTWEFVVPATTASGANTAWGAAPDWDGDGDADAAVGTKVGRAYVYLSNGTGLATTPALTLMGSGSYGQWVASAGDVNGDGYADLYVSNEIHAGGNAATGVQSAVLVGGLASGPAAGLGDVNGDGYADLVVVQPTSFAATVYYGGPGGISGSTTLQLCNPVVGGANCGGTPGNNFNVGTPIYGAAGGDVNGDGFGDVVLSEFWYDFQTNRGARIAWVFNGGPTGISTSPATTLNGVALFPTVQLTFGYSCGTADVNGDGYADVLVGGPDFIILTSASRAYVFQSAGSSGIANDANPNLILGGPNSSGYGKSVAGAGDVNADGYGDVVIGAPQSDPGTAYVYAGGSGGLSASANTVTLPGGATNTDYGIAVAGAGDVNLDGYADFLIGADTANISGSGYSNGAVYLYVGATSVAPTLSPTLRTTIAGPAYMFTTNFGITVALLMPSSRPTFALGWADAARVSAVGNRMRDRAGAD